MAKRPGVVTAPKANLDGHHISLETFAANGQIGFVAWMRADSQVMYPQSFAQITGII
jgi:hypothetical protein